MACLCPAVCLVCCILPAASSVRLSADPRATAHTGRPWAVTGYEDTRQTAALPAWLRLSGADRLTPVWQTLDAFFAGDRSVCSSGGIRSTALNSDTRGAVYTSIGPTTAQLFHVGLHRCQQSGGIVFRALAGLVIWNLPANVTPSTSHPPCFWTVEVPEGHLLAATRVGGSHISLKILRHAEQLVEHHIVERNFLLAPSENKIRFRLQLTSFDKEETARDYLTGLCVLFLATEQHVGTTLRVTVVSPASGYLTSPGYPFTLVPALMKVWHSVDVPKDQSVMLSFKQNMFVTDRLIQKTSGYKIKMYKVKSNKKMLLIWTKYGLLDTPPEVYHSSIIIELLIQKFQPAFKISFSFHHFPSLPTKTHSGLFNCSVPYFPSFQDHLHCNMKQDCESREDEGGHCPFSSPACDGNMAVGDVKCYSLHVTEKAISWSEADSLCRAKGGWLVSVQSVEELTIFQDMIHIANRVSQTYIGLVLDTNVTNLYRKTWRWAGNTIAYFTFFIKLRSVGSRDFTCFLNVQKETIFYCTGGHSRSLVSYACEYVLTHNVLVHLETKEGTPVDIEQSGDGILKFDFHQNYSNSPLVECSGGHLLHEFLKCDLQSRCLVKRFNLKCSLGFTAVAEQKPREEFVGMFVCNNLIHTVPFTFVCNFVQDCLDGSDETFCTHEQSRCGQSQYCCANGQCVSGNVMRSDIECDRVSDCLDLSDETDCRTHRPASPPAKQLVNASVQIDFLQSYEVIVTPVDRQYKCPHTHFRCQGHWAYCLPVYVRCNGYYDCPQREDEGSCERYVCPGFYRCRGTRVCVHVSQLCDGLAQCQGQDDEMLCDFSCPLGCQCQGWAFVCPQAFPAASFPQLRYLDAGHSLMDLAHFVNNSYLVWLNLQFCGLETIFNTSLGNLQSLEVSNNRIQSLSTDLLQNFPNLKEIRLSHNPLQRISAGHVVSQNVLLQKIDVSNTQLAEFDCGVFSQFLAVSALNLSHCGTVRITRSMFNCFVFLNELDVRGTRLLPNDEAIVSIAGRLTYMETLFSDDYRHCCPSMLPNTQHRLLCLAPLSGFSSCSDLLCSQLHRAYLWLLLIFSFLGNVICLLSRKRYWGGSKMSSVEVLMFHLIAANTVNGVYVCIIIAAQFYFRGNFVMHERDWTQSSSCKIAGSLVFVSSEATCLMVFVTSVERLVAVCFSPRRLHVKFFWLAGVLSWTAPALLSAGHWLLSGEGRSSMGNLCILTFGVQPESDSSDDWWRVLTVVNTTLAVLTGISQCLVYCRYRSTYVTATHSQVSHDLMLAARVMTLVSTDVMWRLGMVVAGVLASPLGRDVFVTLLVLSVPLKPVLNPLLYANALFMEKKKMEVESRLLTRIRKKMKPKHRKRVSPICDYVTPLPSYSCKENLLKFLTKCLRLKTLSIEDVQAMLTQYDHIQ